MMEELVDEKSELDDERSDDDYYIPEDTFARASYTIGYPMTISGSK